MEESVISGEVFLPYTSISLFCLSRAPFPSLPFLLYTSFYLFLRHLDVAITSFFVSTTLCIHLLLHRSYARAYTKITISSSDRFLLHSSVLPFTIDHKFYSLSDERSKYALAARRRFDRKSSWPMQSKMFSDP